MAEEITPIRGVQSGWSGFLWEFLRNLAKMLSQDNYVGALKLLHTYVKFLPCDMKEKMACEIAEVNRLLSLIRRFEGAADVAGQTPFYIALSTDKTRSAVNGCIADFVERFTDIMVNLLDEKGYLERRQKEVLIGRGPTTFGLPGLPE